MITNETKASINSILISCAEEGMRKRPEIHWLNKMYTRFQKQEGIFRKTEVDELIYSKMYAALPPNPSATLKIRYWRTGRHTPSNRAQCTAFGHALNLSEEEMRTLFQFYYDRSDLVFPSKPEPGTPQEELYQQRAQKMNRLVEEYLWKVHPLRRLQLNVRHQDLEHNLRHFYFMDARSCLSEECRRAPEKHITSINYESEFKQQLRLLGEIPRKSMIRHIFLLGQPYLSREVVSQYLNDFGFLPLQEDHTTVSGERLDLLVIGFLHLYEHSCAGLSPEECSEWLREAYRYLDWQLVSRDLQKLRFLYFKALE